MSGNQLKVSITDNVKVEDTAVKVELFKERNPSNWRIMPADGDNITAVANNTGEVYEGSIEGFNKKLRG
jgi:hypothetical protein